MLRALAFILGLSTLCAAVPAQWQDGPPDGPPPPDGPFVQARPPRDPQGGLPPPPPPDAPEEAKLLFRMVRAELAMTYSGTRVVIDNTENQDRREVELVLHSGPNTRVTYPKDSPRNGEVVVERGGRRWHWKPRENVIVVGEAQRRERLAEHFGHLPDLVQKGALRLAFGKDAQVAGRRCRTVELKRPDGGLVSRLLIDSEKYILLKQETYDRINPKRVVGGFYFTEIDFDAKAKDEDFVVNRPGARVVQDDILPLDDVQKRLDFRLLRPGWLPRGYATVGGKPLNRPGLNGAQIICHRAGTEPVSIFQFRGRISREDLRRFRPEGFNMASRQVEEVFIAVVGKLPLEELTRVAQGLR